MATAQEVTYDRPPEGLARGRYPAPPWLILGLAALVVVACIVFFIARARAPRAQIDLPKPPPRDGTAGGPDPRASSEP
jgi:hypothetical protein